MMFNFISQFYVKDDNSPTVVLLSSVLTNKSTSRTALALTGKACGHAKGIEGITFYLKKFNEQPGYCPMDSPQPEKMNTKLYVLFNFFQHYPWSREDERLGFGYKKTLEKLQQQTQFIEGMLLKCVHHNAIFPFIHYVVFNKQVIADIRPKWKNQILSLYKQCNNVDSYEEFHGFVDSSLSHLPKRPSSTNTAYIITVFRTIPNEPSEFLDNNWNEWSGANFIANAVPPHLRLQRLTFHKMCEQLTVNSERFTYVMMCELSDALTDLPRTMCFVEKIRDRMCGYTALYTIDHFF